MAADLTAFIDRWLHHSSGSERSNKDGFLYELCDLLGVARPDGKANDPEKDRYVFEHDVPTAHEGGKVTTRKIDLYKHGCFLLEAKQGSSPGTPKKGSFARRDTPAWHIGMRDAYGQALSYAASMTDPPPFIVIVDIGYCFDLYATFDRSLHRPFPDPLHHRIWLRDLATNPKHIETLRLLWTDPTALDPSRHAAKVTERVAQRIAKLARSLEDQGHPSELVARFLMRCLFTMFAEDVGLLPPRTFTDLVKDHWLPRPASFTGLGGVSSLWQAMNDGSTAPLIGKLLRFNGGLFADTGAIPLTRADLELLLDAAEHDWADVEPAIFGTLLERALNPKERHMLGAHFTPRAYVERLVRPTIEEPLREEWENVQAAARKLRLDDKVEEARKTVHAFLRKLCDTRVLDPACGSGNFLYVALDLFKRIEGEVLALLRELGEAQERLHIEGERVTPRQFLGIEVKPWAKEIADLVLWIGYLQWHYRSHGKAMPPPEPVLHAYGNIECRDAVLEWDGAPVAEIVRDAKGKPVTRWDGVTLKKSPTTGEDVPDETATVPVYSYPNPRKATWPPADYIVGNPPFVGTRRMRLTLGDGYVDALAAAAPSVPENADYVMYWWDHAAELVQAGLVRRFGLITTNSITQSFNRATLQRRIGAKDPISIAFAIPDHPWVDTIGGAAVRVAMTVGVAGDQMGRLLRVTSEKLNGDDVQIALSSPTIGIISQDLRVGASPARAGALRSNAEVAYWGAKFYGDGFIVTEAQASSLGKAMEGKGVARPFFSARDFTQIPRRLWVLDCDGLTEEQLRVRHPATYQHLLDHVKPVRDHNPRPLKRDRWWILGENQPGMRRAVGDLKRYIATPETARHRVFQFFPTHILAEGGVTVIAMDDAMFLGTLSSRIHVVWALAAGGRLGVGNDPRYNKTRCFDPYPFPNATPAQQQRIRDLGESLDAHRKARQAQHPALTITGMYNVLEKLRKGEALSDKDKIIHDQGLVSVLKKIHDDLDAAVFDAYGWPHDLTDEQILQRLVDLNAERAEEERKGHVRWLRPELQNPAGARAAAQGDLIETEEAEEGEAAAAPAEAKAWPKKLAEKIAAVRDRVTGWTRAASVEEVAAAFKRAPRKEVEEILDSLAAVGVLTVLEVEGARRWRATGKAA